MVLMTKAGDTKGVGNRLTSESLLILIGSSCSLCPSHPGQIYQVGQIFRGFRPGSRYCTMSTVVYGSGLAEIRVRVLYLERVLPGIERSKEGGGWTVLDVVAQAVKIDM